MPAIYIYNPKCLQSYLTPVISIFSNMMFSQYSMDYMVTSLHSIFYCFLINQSPNNMVHKALMLQLVPDLLTPFFLHLSLSTLLSSRVLFQPSCFLVSVTKIFPLCFSSPSSALFNFY